MEQAFYRFLNGEKKWMVKIGIRKILHTT
jgi:hypothetical protein